MAKETRAKEKNASDTGGREAAARQQQASTQSMPNPSKADDQRSDANTATQTKQEIGSTVGQEQVSDGRERANEERRTSDSSQRPSAGTPDLARERATDGDIERGGGASQDSLVGESTGAFKERP